jgi:hypothetical protein
MSLINLIKSWFARPVKKVDAMLDENGQEIPDAQAAPEVVTAASAALDPVNTDVLKKLLTFLGHDVEKYWEEVIALAKKAV